MRTKQTTMQRIVRGSPITNSKIKTHIKIGQSINFHLLATELIQLVYLNFLLPYIHIPQAPQQKNKVRQNRSQTGNIKSKNIMKTIRAQFELGLTIIPAHPNGFIGR
jgi:hypothetical protein